MALVDDAHDRRVRAPACRRGRRTSGRCPRSRVCAGAGIRPDGVLDPVEHALALVALGGLTTASNRSLHIVGLEQLRIAAAGRDRGDVADEQHVEDVGAPDQRVALDVPAVERFADRGENLGGVELGGDVAGGVLCAAPAGMIGSPGLASCGPFLLTVASSSWAAVRRWRRQTAGSRGKLSGIP